MYFISLSTTTMKNNEEEKEEEKKEEACIKKKFLKFTQIYCHFLFFNNPFYFILYISSIVITITVNTSINARNSGKILIITVYCDLPAPILMRKPDSRHNIYRGRAMSVTSHCSHLRLWRVYEEKVMLPYVTFKAMRVPQHFGCALLQAYFFLFASLIVLIREHY